MRHKIIDQNRAAEHVTQERNCDHAASLSTRKTDTLNTHWLAYSYPFVAIFDLTPALDELRKTVKNWFLNKRQNINMKKNKTHGT